MYLFVDTREFGRTYQERFLKHSLYSPPSMCKNPKDLFLL